MRKLLIPLILCLICAMLFCACEEEAADGSMVPVKDDSGAITGYEAKYHNDNGDITRLDVYDANQEYDHYVLYEYDSDNRLTKETQYQANGIGEFFYEYTYSDDGSLIEKDYCTAKDGSETILYDADGNEKEKYSYDKQGELYRYEVMESGKWTEAPIPTEAATEATTEAATKK